MSVEATMVDLRDVPGKGKGLIATRKIPKGTRILSEEPVITVPEDVTDRPDLRASIRRQVDKLTPDQRQAFLAMCNIYPGDAASQYLGIIRTNGLPMDEGSGIFLVACRINHARDNNAQKGWNESIEKHTVHALRDIDEGEEITITYLGVLNNRRTRQVELRKKFKRLDEILELESRISRHGIMGILSDPKRMLRYVDRQVQLYKEHNVDDIGLPRAFFDAAQITAAHGDLARSRIFTERAVAGWLLIQGDDDPQVLKARRLAMDPSGHLTHGYSAAWKNWLWKKEKDDPSEEVGVFHNQEVFPSFLRLPDENEIEHNFFEIRGGVHYRPRRHWCLLAEIVDSVQFIRLYMHIKDVSGMTIPLNFHTKTRCCEIAPSLLLEGYAVAILYAEQHAIAFSEPGIRLEDPTLCKIFPVSMNNLLSLSDRVCKFSTETSGLKTCHGCGKQASSLMKCAKCSLFWYCNAACQKIGWTEKDHKADCKLLRDGDLKGLLALNEGNFQGPVKFPLAC